MTSYPAELELEVVTIWLHCVEWTQYSIRQESVRYMLIQLYLILDEVGLGRRRSCNCLTRCIGL